MAERSYDPFNGYSRQAGAAAGGDRQAGLGKNLNAVDWDKAKTRGDWVVFDNKDAAAATAAKQKEVAGAPTGLPEAEALAWRAEHNVTIFGSNCPAPMPDFKMLTMLPPFIQKKFEAQGFTAPTAIQAQSWPILFQHRDFVGIAKTGSGKTLAFIVPAIAHIAVQQQLRPGDGPLVVVLAPTRELAQQTEAETRKVLPSTMRCACIYGGAPKGPQLQQLRDGVHILVATPGRLIDFLEIRRTNLLRTTYLVLDEADRMLDMGFEPQVRKICSQIRPDRQTVLFSATWPKEIQALAAQFQRDFIRIHIGSTDLLANPDVAQHFVHTPDSGKFGELRKLMTRYSGKRILVFCKTKKTADFLERMLRGAGLDVMAIHGDKEQRQREYILDRFRRDTKLCVVATDVAARGLDIKELEVVVNYDFPMQIDDYVHRIGRTGRAGAKGDAHTFISKTETQMSPAVVQELVKIVSKANQEVPAFLAEWAAQRRYSAVKRQRDGGAGGSFGRAPPAMHYNHSRAPTGSFDPSGSGNGSAPHAMRGHSHSNGAPAQFASAGTAIRQAYTRFADSDDEVDHRATHKVRAE